MERGYATAGIEPQLEELLNDPIAELIMRRDGIAVADVLRTVEMARSRLADRTPRAAEAIGELEPPLLLPRAAETERPARSPAGRQEKTTATRISCKAVRARSC